MQSGMSELKAKFKTKMASSTFGLYGNCSRSPFFQYVCHPCQCKRGRERFSSGGSTGTSNLGSANCRDARWCLSECQHSCLSVHNRRSAKGIREVSQGNRPKRPERTSIPPNARPRHSPQVGANSAYWLAAGVYSHLAHCFNPTHHGLSRGLDRAWDGAPDDR